MTKRKSLSKKIRFEVFKRDSFKCQYCGRGAPDVILEVDHIKPVSEGGTDDLTNLITSCFDCNRGKSNVLLDDKSILEKQRRQLEELNERRLQLKMMMEWREELITLEEEKIKFFTEKWKELTYSTVNNNGIKHVKRWMKRYDLNLLLDCMEISLNQYGVYGDDGYLTDGSVEKVFDMIPRIAANKLKEDDEPYLGDLYYIRGILRNRLHYVNEYKALEYLKLAHLEVGISIDSLKEFAKEVKNWTEFRVTIERLFEGENIDY